MLKNNKSSMICDTRSIAPSLAAASVLVAVLGSTTPTASAAACSAGTFFSAGSATTDATCAACTNGCSAWESTGGFHRSSGEPTDEIEDLRWDECAALCGQRGKKECEYWTYLKAEQLCLTMKEKGEYVDDGANNYVEGDPCPAANKVRSARHRLLKSSCSEKLNTPIRAYPMYNGMTTMMNRPTCTRLARMAMIST